MKKALSIFCTLIMVLSVFGNFAVTAFGASLTISYITVDEAFSYYEKTNGYESDRWNEETDEYEYYWYYYLPDYYDITVHYEDGTEQTYGYWDLYDEFGEYPSYDYNQDDSPLAVGENLLPVTFMGYETTVTLNIKEVPFSAISIDEPVKMYENTNGREYERWNEEIGDYELYWRYYVPSSYKVTLYYKDGTTQAMTYDELYEEFGTAPSADGSDQYSTPWGVGSHAVPVTFMGLSTELEVIVEECPISSVSVDEELTLYENSNGYEREYYDENTGEYVPCWYYYYNDPSLTVNYKDGSTEILTFDELGEKFGDYPEMEDTQYQEPWGIGKHEVSISFMNLTATMTVNIEKFSFNFTVTPTESTTYYKNSNGHETTAWNEETQQDETFWYYYIPDYNITLTLPDGTTKDMSAWEFEEEYGIEVEIDHGQYENHWDVGEHNIIFRINDAEATMTVTVEKAPFESISIDEAITVYEYTNGCWEYDDEDEKYWEYDIPSQYITLNYSDGSTRRVHSWDLYDEFGVDCRYRSNQYYNHWSVGENTVEVEFMGLTTDLIVNVLECPFTSISVDEPVTLFEEVDGYWEEIWYDEMDGDGESFFYYSYRVPSLTVTYKDGTTETISYWDLDERYGAYPQKSDNQYNEHWGLGEHKADVSYMGLTTQMTVNVVEFPVVSFTVNPTSDTTFYEYTHGYMSSTTDENGDDYDFWHYNIPDYNLTLTLNDGTTETLRAWEVEEKYGVDVDVYSDQYNEPWGVGEHEFTLSIKDINATLPVTVKENPIESISVENYSAQIWEGTNGYEEDIWDDETGDSIGTYWRYSYPRPSITLHYKDGSEETVEFWDLYDMFGVDPGMVDTQYMEPWGIGEHEVTVSFMGCEAAITVEIVESPIVSFSVNAIGSSTYFENTNGYWYEDMDAEAFYWCYDVPDYEITLKLNDGTSKTLDRWDFEDEFGFNPSIYHSQYEKPWGIGEHEVIFKIGNLQASITVEIIEFPLESFSVTPTSSAVFYENTNGYRDEYWDSEAGEYKDFWYYQIPNCEVTLNYKDGTSETLSVWELEYEYGFDVSVYHDQYEKPWGVGTNEATVRIGEFESKLKIEILASPVKSLQVLDLKLAENGNVTGKVQINYKDGKKDVAVIHPDDYYNHSYKGYDLDVAVTDDNIVTVSYIGATVTYKLPTEPEDSFVYIKKNDTAIITGYVGPIEKDMTLTIPSEIDGLKVVAIADFTVSGMSEDYYGRTELIKTLVLPDSVTAFSFGGGLYNLETLKLGKGIREIDINELGKKYNLKNINIKNDVYKDIDGVLYTADGKTLVYYPLGREGVYEVPAGVKDIRALPPYVEYTMKDASVFKEVDGVVYTADMKTLVSCNTDKTGNYVMPETVADMYDYAFSGCTSLESVTVSKKVTEISYGAFEGCTSLKSVDLPASLKKIDQYAFDSCKNLETLKLHDIAAWCGVDFLSYPMSFVDNVYLNNKALTSITIPEGVKTINYGAFISLPASIKSVTIPSTLNVCEGIESRGRLDAVYTPDLAAWCGIDFSYDSPLKFADKFYVNGKEVTSVVIPGSVKRIGDYAFAYAPIKSLTIPETVDEIGFEAFSGTELDKLYVSNLKKWCTADYKYNPMANAKNVYIDKKLVTELFIPEGVTEIPDYRFSGVPFKKVKFPSTIKKIGEGAFAYSNLESYSFASGAKNVDIDSYAFAGTNIETASYGSESTKINSTVFYNSKLTKLNISESVTEIAYGAFYGSSNLKTINAPNTAISIKAHAFDGTAWYNSQPTGMTFIGKNLYDYKGYAYGKIVVPNGTKAVSELAFEYQDGVEGITLPSSLELIEAGAFAYTDIETITIPENVNKIGVYAFGRTNLKDIKVSSKNKYFTAVDGVLYNKDMTELIMCAPKKTGKIVVPCSVKYIHDYAFADVENVTVEITTPNVKIGDYAIGYGGYSLYSDRYRNDWIGDTGVNIKAPKGSTAEKYAEDNYIYYAGESSASGHNYDDNVCTKCGDWNGTEKEVALKSATNVTGGVKISWSAIPGAEKYVIYRKTSAKADWKKLYTTKTAASSYTDKTAKSGTKYYYTVKAARDGEYSKYDNDGVSRTYLAVPKISSVANKSSYVEIKWGKVTGASSYDVYRKVKGGSWKKLDSTKSTTFKDKTAKAGKVYEYKVRAKVGKSTTSEFSTAKKTVRLTTPKLTKVTPSKGKVTFTFGKVTGAEKYYIYRKTGSGSYKKIATTTSTKYVDKSVKKGTTYTYTVKAVKSSYSSAYNSTGLKVKAK